MNDRESILELEKCFENFNSSISHIQKVYSRLWRQIEEYNHKDNIPRETLIDLAGNLAHEIRNPLGGIVNFVALLSDDLGLKKSKKVKGILEGVDRINKIVENLILFSKPVEPQKIRCNFVDVIKSAVETVKKNSIKNGKSYQFIFRFIEPEIYVSVDPQLIIQALQNIIHNSVESMSEGGKIKISISENEKLKKLSLRIADEGKGILDGDVTKPFMPFYTTKTNGMGLGLSTTRMIIEQHGGQIFLKNKTNKGVVVVVNLTIF